MSLVALAHLLVTLTRLDLKKNNDPQESSIPEVFDEKICRKDGNLMRGKPPSLPECKQQARRLAPHMVSGCRDCSASFFATFASLRENDFA